MADARSEIFAALRAARAPGAPALRRSRPRSGPADADRIRRFGAALEAAGGRLVDARRAGPIATLAGLPGLAASGHVYSTVEGVESRGAGLSARAPADLTALDVAVLRGECGVAESGAVWHRPSDGLERAAVLLAEHVVLLLPVDALVEDLHDAYARIDVTAGRFGWFLCGPSKTADIEQALVLGAHGAARASVLIA